MKRYFSTITIAAMLLSFAVSAKDYRGAELYSMEEVKYGKFEIRMKTAYGSGTLSTFFLYYNDSYLGTPEPWREVDVEVFGKSKNSFQSNIITGNLASKVTSEMVHTSADALCDDYHTYTVEWTPDYIAWFLDGVELRKATGKQVTDCQDKMQSYRFNIWISDSPGWVGAFDPSILPLYQYINWMKYYEYTPGAGENGSDFKLKWTDDFNTFSNSRWAKGDWTFDGNLVDFAAKNIVVQDGKLILCLTNATNMGHSGTAPVDKGESGTAVIGNSVITEKKMNSQGVYPVLNLNSVSPAAVDKRTQMLYSITGREAKRIDRDANGIYLIKTEKKFR